MGDRIKSWLGRLMDTQVWRSIFRHGPPTTDFNRSLVMFSNVFLHLLPVKVSRKSLNFKYAFHLGALSLYAFFLTLFTGVFLMFYYVPDVRRAYNDIQDLQTVIFFGNLTRDLHRWAAHAMVFLTWFHMTRVFLTGAYKPPREFNWVVGVFLLVLTLLLSWTGYLLPWDQLALWAITVGSEMAKASPFIGRSGPFGPQMGMRADNDIGFVLFGGTQIGQNALLRFYILHCLVLPLFLVILLAVHFWRARKDGFSGPL